MNLDDILKECKSMQEFMEMTTSDDADELVSRLRDINVYLARSGKLLADAKMLQDEKTSQVFKLHIDMISEMPATIGNRFIQSQVKQENYAVNWLERLNKAFVHVGDNTRTQISFSKEQLKLTRSGY